MKKTIQTTSVKTVKKEIMAEAKQILNLLAIAAALAGSKGKIKKTK